MHSLYASDMLRTYVVQARSPALDVCRGRSRDSAMYQKSSRASHPQDVQPYMPAHEQAQHSPTAPLETPGVIQTEALGPVILGFVMTCSSAGKRR